MNICKHCNDTLYTEIYDTCMTCFEKQPAESTMTKTIKQYQQDSLWYQKEIKRLESCCSNLQGVVKGDAYNIKRLSEENERLVKIYNDQKNILHEVLHELPVGNVTTHTYENIPERVAYYVKENAKCEKEVTDALLATWVAEESLEVLEESIKAYYEYYAGFAVEKGDTALQMLDKMFKNKPVNTAWGNTLTEEHAVYKAALEEIVKRPRRSDTCKLIAQKALGRLNDEEYQPELLIEENLALKMKIEDLQTVINEQILNKVFREKVNPLTCCPDCGEYWDYHHEQHCKANSLPPSQNNDA